jgi:hypothetical protein
VKFALGCFQGIQLSVPLIVGFLQMCCHTAFSQTPPGGGIRKDQAVIAGGEFFDFLAAFTLLNGVVTGTAVKPAPFLAHEKAVQSFFYACTNHGYHVLSFQFRNKCMSMHDHLKLVKKNKNNFLFVNNSFLNRQ